MSTNTEPEDEPLRFPTRSLTATLTVPSPLMVPGMIRTFPVPARPGSPGRLTVNSGAEPVTVTPVTAIPPTVMPEAVGVNNPLPPPSLPAVSLPKVTIRGPAPVSV